MRHKTGLPVSPTLQVCPRHNPIPVLARKKPTHPATVATMLPPRSSGTPMLTSRCPTVATTPACWNSVWPVYFLGHWVRDMCLMSLEQARQKMSALPAWFSDMKNRGTLRVGDYADVMVYNMDELGLPLRQAQVRHRLSWRREAAGPDADGHALHAGQWHGHFPGERMHRSPARKAASAATTRLASRPLLHRKAKAPPVIAGPFPSKPSLRCPGLIRQAPKLSVGLLVALPGTPSSEGSGC